MCTYVLEVGRKNFFCTFSDLKTKEQAVGVINESTEAHSQAVLFHCCN